MRIPLALSALVLAAVSAAPANAAPVIESPVGAVCSYGSMLDPRPGADGSIFNIKGGPVLPVSTSGRPIEDVAMTCTMEIVPATYPARTLVATTQNVGGVAVLVPVAEAVPTGAVVDITRCMYLTWTDAGSPRSYTKCGI